MANFIFELSNSVRTINQQATWFFLLYFLVHGLWFPGPNGIATADIRRFVFGLALGMFLHDTGGLVIGYVIWLFNAVLIGKTIGQQIIALAHILIVAVLSYSRFGNWLWLALVGFDIVYILWALF
jgi:hypothetical protein